MLTEPNYVKIAVLVSGNGTNLQALIDAQAKGELINGKIVKVISSRSDVYAITRANSANISAEVIERTNFRNSEDFDKALYSVLQQCGAELIILAGFMSILGDTIINKYKDRIINVHPSLIPSFCGTGYYGLRVHEEVLKMGVKITGATVHLVNEIPDGGQILLQKAVNVYKSDTPLKLQQRVMKKAEWLLLPKAAVIIADRILISRLNNDKEINK